MEFRLVLASDKKRVEERLNMARLPDVIEYKPSYNIVPDDFTYVITNYQTKELQLFKFGLRLDSGKVVNYIRAEGNRNKEDNPNYTGSKGIFLLPEYKLLIRNQRCLIVADAIIIGTESKQPYLIFRTEKQRPFTLAGIWNKYLDEKSNEEVFSFAIITVPANKLFQKLNYKRMPVIIDDLNQGRWVRNTTPLFEILNMLYCYPHNLMNAYPISDKICNPDINDKALIQPTGKLVYQAKKYVRTNYVRKRDEKEIPPKLTADQNADGLPSWAMRDK